MEEAASLLKREGAKEVIGIVIAKAKFGQDR
jgi:predicted amidophosphoribosyltransferase